MKFLPKSKLGKWAVGFIFFWPLFTFLGFFTVNWLYPNISAGNNLIEDLNRRPALPIIVFLGIISGLISFPLSLISIFKKGERSILAFFSAFLGLLLIVLLFGEFFIQH